MIGQPIGLLKANLTADFSHAVKVENGLQGKKEILNEMILLEKDAWQMIDNIPTVRDLHEIDRMLENVSFSKDFDSDR